MYFLNKKIDFFESFKKLNTLVENEIGKKLKVSYLIMEVSIVAQPLEIIVQSMEFKGRRQLKTTNDNKYKMIE